MSSSEFVDSGGTSDGPDSDDGSSTVVSGGSDGSSFFSLPTVLSTFAQNPRRFIIGAVLATIVEGVFGVVTTILDTILLVLAGSEPSTFDAPGEQLGIADIPVAVANALGGAGDTAGSGIINAIEALNEPIFSLASSLGPFSPIVLVTVIGLETIAVLWLLQRAVYVAADLLQLGGLTE